MEIVGKLVVLSSGDSWIEARAGARGHAEIDEGPPVYPLEIWPSHGGMCLKFNGVDHQVCWLIYTRSAGGLSLPERNYMITHLLGRGSG